MRTPDDNESQLDRFRKVARELGADEADDALDRAMGKLDLRTKPTPPPEPKKPQDK